jgi:hypothetical protein
MIRYAGHRIMTEYIYLYIYIYIDLLTGTNDSAVVEDSTYS